MTNTFFGTKKNMTEAYVGDTRVAVTAIELFPMKVSAVKDTTTQVVFGPVKKHGSKALAGHLKASGVASRYVREIAGSEGDQVGNALSLDSLVPGAVVTVQGTTKGKGFAGVMKRWNFAGGPKTHGQSDRARAPGSIGQGTTPGRVHRGKKMAGRMGSDTQTVKNMMCVAVAGNTVWLTGPVPGSRGSLIKLMVTGTKDAPSLTFLNGYNPKVVEAAPIESVEAPAETPSEENKS